MRKHNIGWIFTVRKYVEYEHFNILLYSIADNIQREACLHIGTREKELVRREGSEIVEKLCAKKLIISTEIAEVEIIIMIPLTSTSTLLAAEG